MELEFIIEWGIIIAGKLAVTTRHILIVYMRLEALNVNVTDI